MNGGNTWGWPDHGSRATARPDTTKRTTATVAASPAARSGPRHAGDSIGSAGRALVDCMRSW